MSDVLEDVVVDVENEVTPEKAPLSNKVLVDGTEYEIKRLHAKKVARIAALFGQSLIKGNVKLKELKAPSTTNIALGVLASLQEDDLVELAALLIDVDKKFADEHFDLVWVMDALGKQVAVSNLKAVIENFTVLLSQIQN